jgi:flavin reductase (DIM6/NTAB) family NADH-FMN oxidoreductase RutF
MIVDSGAIPALRFAQLMNSVIVPRPIAFVTTVDATGRVNAAPFSWFCGLATSPPLLGISISPRDGGPKDTLRNVRETHEFVVNVVTETMAAQIVHASGDWPADVDELALTALTAVPSDLVRPPCVAESPVNLECRLDREIALGESCLVVGEILRAHLRDDVLTAGRVDVTKLRPLARLGGEQYTGLGELMRLSRPKVGRAPGSSPVPPPPAE